MIEPRERRERKALERERKARDRENVYIVLWLASITRPTRPDLSAILLRCVRGEHFPRSRV